MTFFFLDKEMPVKVIPSYRLNSVNNSEVLIVIHLTAGCKFRKHLHILKPYEGADLCWTLNLPFNLKTVQLISAAEASAQLTRGPYPGAHTHFRSVVRCGHWFESLFLSEFPAGYRLTAHSVLFGLPFAILAALNFPVDNKNIRWEVQTKIHAWKGHISKCGMEDLK